MTRRRNDCGREETPFGRWLRANRDLDSITHGVTAHDVDMMVHKYKDNVDGVGARTVHLMMNIEVKALGRRPTPEQMETLFFNHQLQAKKIKLKSNRAGVNCSVWHFGWYVLVMPGVDPGPPDTTLTWCRFDENGELNDAKIITAELVQLIRFDLRPDTLRPLRLRRHHKTRFIEALEKAPLGFVVSTMIRRSS